MDANRGNANERFEHAKMKCGNEKEKIKGGGGGENRRKSVGEQNFGWYINGKFRGTLDTAERGGINLNGCKDS